MREGMNRRISIATLVFGAFLLGGCTVSQDLRDYTAGDLNAAIALAQDDPDATACYEAILKVQAGKTTLDVKVEGPVSAFQKVRNLRRGLGAGIPPEVHRKCAVLVIDAQRTLMRLGLRLTGLPIPGR